MTWVSFTHLITLTPDSALATAIIFSVKTDLKNQRKGGSSISSPQQSLGHMEFATSLSHHNNDHGNINIFLHCSLNI